MIKRKKSIVALLLASMMSMSLVGCSSSGEEEASGEKSLTVWSHLTPDEVKELQPIAKKWGEENGVNVKLVEDKGDMQAYIQAANSSKGPDIMFGLPHDNLGTFEKAGLLAQVPEGVINQDDYASNQLIDAVTLNGKQYALPIAQETTTLFYNKDLVDKVPETMEEVVKIGKEKGFIFDVANFYPTYGLIAANGGYVYKNNDGTLDPTDIGLNNEGAVKGYQFIQDLVVKDKLISVDMTGDIASGEFMNGKAAFYISGPWDVKSFKDAGLNFGVVPFPTLGGNTVKSFMGVQTAFVSSKSKNQELAWDLAKYLSENSSDILLNTGNRIPVLKSVVDSEEFAKNEYMLNFAKQAEVAEPMPNIPEVQAMWGPAGENIRLLMTEQLSAKECADLTVEQIKEGIAQQK
ncbi:MAG: maltose ABC transporter substrate-binding protein [Peptostreptococcaceae bacterium]